MRLVNLAQQSQEWIAFKGKRIGASQIAAILGISEYATPYDVWLKLTGKFEPSQGGNVATARGNRLEPVIRARHELETGLDFLPLTALHDNHDRIMASFDGINVGAKRLCEIKVPKQEVIIAARDSIIPDKYQQLAKEWGIAESCEGGLVHPEYYPQVQQQLEIAGPGYVCDFLVGEFENKNGRDRITKIHRVVVKPNPDFQKYAMITAIGFLDLVDKGIQPPLMDRDVMELTDPSSIALFERLSRAKAAKDANKCKATQAEFEDVKEEVIEHIEIEAKHVNVACGGVVLRKNKNGNWSVKNY